MSFGHFTSFMAPLPGNKRMKQINIQTKEGNTSLDILKKKNKNSFSSSGYF